MYQNYFGFKERPFQLVPNPAYLFLSRSHEEAMAHLTYAASEGDGFVAVTGEVGTGKTTLCRAFIESLDDHSEVAYIFNPKLTAIELLQNICDEFGIDTEGCNTTKDLIDNLNRFLLDKKGQRKQVMLIIDEAQNLSLEVLEQIRLLSNLETNTEKLLQIVLAGQPEMGDVLNNYELRQLNQRITLNCSLAPLTFNDTVQYIRHRIRIAARNEGVDFSARAFRKIYAFSRGIPRLIHIVCDRALLAAYVTNQWKITGKVVDTAIRELDAGKEIKRLLAVENKRTIYLAILLCLIVFLLFTVKPGDFGISSIINSGKTTTTPSDPEKPIPAQTSDDVPDEVFLSTETAQKTEVTPTKTVVSSLNAFLAGTNSATSMDTALSGALTLWGVRPSLEEYTEGTLNDPETYFSLIAGEYGFQIHRMQSNREIVARLNLPAIFEFRRQGETATYYLTLCRIDEGKLSFLADASGTYIEVTSEEVDNLWSGLVYIPWINFFEYNGTTPFSGSKDDILKLKRILAQIGYSRLPSDPVYDRQTVAVVKEIQHGYGIPVDGFVGPLTKIALYNELPGLDIPHIQGKQKVTD